MQDTARNCPLARNWRKVKNVRRTSKCRFRLRLCKTACAMCCCSKLALKHSAQLSFCLCQKGEQNNKSFAEVNGELVQRVLYGDSAAAIAIASLPDGPWRTRHLRLRSNALRQRLRLRNIWALRHLPGTMLVADHLTKPINPKQRWLVFMRYMGLQLAENLEENQEVNKDAEHNNKIDSKEIDSKNVAEELRVGRIRDSYANARRREEKFLPVAKSCPQSLARVISTCFAKRCFAKYGFFSLKTVSLSEEKCTHLLCNDFPSFSRRRNG